MDFSAWNLPGSVNVPLHTLHAHSPKPFFDPLVLEAQWAELEAIFRDELSLSQLREKHVLVICYNGDTARVATSVLRAKGIESDSLRGGYQALRDHGLWGDVGSDATMSNTSSGDVEKSQVYSAALPVSPISMEDDSA